MTGASIVTALADQPTEQLVLVMGISVARWKILAKVVGCK